MLLKMRVWFRHRAFVAGREVDFLIPRPGKRGLLVEVDGDVYHLNLERKEAKDRMLISEGWEVMHFWGSEVLDTPDHVKQTLEAALEGVPRLSRKKKSKSRLRPFCDGCNLAVCLKDCVPGMAASHRATALAANPHPTS